MLGRHIKPTFNKHTGGSDKGDGKVFQSLDRLFDVILESDEIKRCDIRLKERKKENESKNVNDYHTIDGPVKKCREEVCQRVKFLKKEIPQEEVVNSYDW